MRWDSNYFYYCVGKNKFIINNWVKCFQGGIVVKNPPANIRDKGNVLPALGWEESLKEEMATPSGILA